MKIPRSPLPLAGPLAVVMVVLAVLAVLSPLLGAAGRGETEGPAADGPVEPAEPRNIPVDAPRDAQTAVFAGGCFWCMEEAFELAPGVYDAVSGYAGGSEPNPAYEEVARGLTGHYEVVRVYYDPDVITYEELLYVFWRNIDPMDDGGQFCDRGTAYLTGIFYQTDEERRLAEQSRRELEESGRLPRPIVTPIRQLNVIEGDGHDGFWPAEEYHQRYYLVNPLRYRLYKEACGRARRLDEIWGAEAGAPNLRAALRTGAGAAP